LRHPEIYRHLGVEAPRGVLLHGPPGSGKTVLAHAIAYELQVPFFRISAPEVGLFLSSSLFFSVFFSLLSFLRVQCLFCSFLLPSHLIFFSSMFCLLLFSFFFSLSLSVSSVWYVG
jgi:hypothetical protein